MRAGWIIILMIISSAFAEILVSLDCPKEVYAGEVFKCTAKIYNISSDANVLYYIHSEKDRIFADIEDSVKISKNELKELNFEVWAKDVGTDALIFEYGVGELSQAHVTPIASIPGPLSVKVEGTKLEAGKTKEIKCVLEGKGSLVQVLVKYPPQIDGDKVAKVGDVEGRKEFTIRVTPEPLATGKFPVDFEITFADSNGYHKIRNVIYFDVSPPSFAAYLLAAIVVIALAIYVFRKKKGQ